MQADAPVGRKDKCKNKSKSLIRKGGVFVLRQAVRLQNQLARMAGFVDRDLPLALSGFERQFSIPHMRHFSKPSPRERNLLETNRINGR